MNKASLSSKKDNQGIEIEEMDEQIEENTNGRWITVFFTCIP
jgi:hypothetical protein